MSFALGLGLGTSFGGKVAFSPAALFAASEPGVWYDPSDLSTLFQDAAGTTPVTAVEQPVGLVLDKTRGLVLGATELVSNPGGPYTETTGYSTVRATVSVVNGKLRITNTGSYGSAQVAISTNVGTTYKVTSGGATCVSGITNDAYLAKADNTSNSTNAVYGSTTVVVFTATATTTYISLQSSTAGNVYDWSGLSVKSLAGNHASQSTSTSRPVLSARVNLLTYTEQFDNAAWTLVNIAAFGSGSVANATTAPNGTTTADLIVPNTAFGTHGIFQAAATVSNGASYKASWYVKPNGYTKLAIVENQVTGYSVAFDATGSGSVLYQDNATGTITALANGWYEITHTSVSGGTLFRPQIFVLPSSYTTGSVIGSWTPNGTSGLYIWGADLRPSNAGVGLPSYQRVGAATSGTSSAAGNADYDTTGFPLYLRFDGTDDFLVTGTINPGSVDKAQVFAGIARTAITTSYQCLLETSTAMDSNNGAISLFSESASGGSRIYAASKGTTSAAAVPGTGVLTGTGPYVLTHQSIIAAPSVSLRGNGTSVATDISSQGTGYYGTHALYLGRRGGSTLPANMNLYSLILRFSAANLDAATIASTETWVNSKTRAF